jgi:hypothetical protein
LTLGGSGIVQGTYNSFQTGDWSQAQDTYLNALLISTGVKGMQSQRINPWSVGYVPTSAGDTILSLFKSDSSEAPLEAPAGMQPQPVQQQQAQAGSPPPASDTTTVGRWMSTDELEAMQNSGTVQAPSNGAGATHVTAPPNPKAFTPQPGSDSVFVEFDVPNSQLNIHDPSQGWGRVFGPGSLEARFATSQGLPAPTSMPPALNIKVITP